MIWKIFIAIFITVALFFILNKKFNLLKKIYTATHSVEGNYETISLAKVKELSDRNMGIVLDVRNPHELSSDGFIKGMVNIPLNELEARLSELDKNKTYITFCAVGGRSLKAAAILSQNGFKNVLNAEDGMKNWPYDRDFSN
ncbi:MAG: rhodanese-like domain-containing protein [Fusobacteriaceae bacterium]